ncbi:unnamed protein product [Lactuca virosa]|uniref:Uncharacterized protein n=1 Tax=Lactuca virosa TaxID=75947 RepID=A0AAU9M099_9ASTR|nr:unnamed protein product [Lactuca virosa]
MIRMIVRKYHTEIKVVEVHEDGKCPPAGNGAIHPPCTCFSGSAAPECAECLLYSSSPASARRQANCRYQEEDRVSVRAIVETVGTEVVAGTMLWRTECKCIVALV